MAHALIAALAIGAAGMMASDTLEHRVQVDHHRGALDARYTATVDIAHRQTGTVASGGRASTLRCAWRANLSVDRQATHGSGTLSRAIEREAVVTGSRPGWCTSQVKAIAREVAQRRDEMRAHLLAVTEEDRTVLMAEADRLHAMRAG